MGNYNEYVLVRNDYVARHVALKGNGHTLCGGFYRTVVAQSIYYPHQIDCKQCRLKLGELTKGV